MIYNSFAYVYDTFMEGTPYEKWAGNIEYLFTRFGIKPDLILELGCGTGNITIPLAKRGYEMIGIDFSVDMLNIAREKAFLNKLDILLLNQDMREFELYGTVDACISLCDSMNYIINPEDFVKVLKLVKNYLNPGGYFIFDLNTECMFELMHKQASFGEARESSAFVCANSYNKKTNIMEYIIDVFYDADNSGRYERFSETHYEKAYTTDEIVKYITASGLTLAGVFGEDLKKPKDACKRLYIACVKDL